MTPAEIEALSSAWLAARLENEAHTARIAALEARVRELEAGSLNLLGAIAQADNLFDKNLDAAFRRARALIGEKP